MYLHGVVIVWHFAVVKHTKQASEELLKVGLQLTFAKPAVTYMISLLVGVLPYDHRYIHHHLPLIRLH